MLLYRNILTFHKTVTKGLKMSIFPIFIQWYKRSKKLFWCIFSNNLKLFYCTFTWSNPKCGSLRHNLKNVSLTWQTFVFVTTKDSTMSATSATKLQSWNPRQKEKISFLFWSCAIINVRSDIVNFKTLQALWNFFSSGISQLMVLSISY